LTVLRRFAGSQTDELAILCRPENRSAAAQLQAEAAYRSLAALLADNGTSFRDLASETLHLRDIRRDLPAVLDARARILREAGQESGTVPLAFIQQPPLDQSEALELSASAMIPHSRDAWSLRDVTAAPSCTCEGCRQSAARLVRIAEQTSLQTTNIYGVGADPFAQAADMFHNAERLLDRCGMGFRDVVRTWIYLRDIDRDYDALNRARREFFLRHGIEPRPASTGIGGVPFPAEHDFSIRMHAVQSPRPLARAPMSTPTLNEAWSYGADFSRGLRVTESNKIALYISGTASIDEAGRTIHVGDFPAQAERMLHNIATLLDRQGATFADLVSGVTYVKHRSDAPILRALLRERGLDGLPLVLVEASLCRPDLLCETEAVAMLSLGTAEA
jgi:enamine deaminase RidA (YjgF/YER057c/UK114 family)